MRKFSFEGEPSTDLMTAIGLLMPLVTNFRMEECARPVKAPRVGAPRHPSMRGSRVNELIKEKLGAGPLGTHEVGSMLEAAGWRASSASPALSALKRQGAVVWDNVNGKWRLA